MNLMTSIPTNFNRTLSILYLTLLCLSMLPVCLSEAHAGESQSFSLTVGKEVRSFRLYRPSTSLNGKPVSLVIVLHGGFGSARQAEESYGWDNLADSQGFIVAYPDGMNRSWNAGGFCCGPALRKSVDDLGFLSGLIETLTKTEPVDPQKVFMTGISNGAAMAYRYACEGSHPVAAIGPVAGSFSFSCPMPHPTAIIAIHGLADQHIPFDGGQGTKGVTQGSWLPVHQTLRLFEQVNQCQSWSTHKDGPVHKETTACLNGRDISLITIEDAGHQWPGGKPRHGLVQTILDMDEPSRELDATKTIWEFFESHPGHL